MMENAFKFALPWQTLIVAVITFGFVPGFILRILVKIYPKGDSRRIELISEMYALKWASRPFFMAQQLETVLFDGLPARAKSAWKSAYEKSRNRTLRHVFVFPLTWMACGGVAITTAKLAVKINNTPQDWLDVDKPLSWLCFIVVVSAVICFLVVSARTALWLSIDAVRITRFVRLLILLRRMRSGGRKLSRDTILGAIDNSGM